MIRYTDSRDLDTCPAAVDMETGDIWINRDVWDQYTEAEQQFILQHERGHYNIPTDYEEEADAYALQQNFGKIRKSLRSSFTALEKANVLSKKRWNSLYKNALEIDAENGNEKAEKELKEKYQSNNYQQKKQKTMRNYPGQITYIQPNYRKAERTTTVIRRADGNENQTSGNTQKSHKTNGIVLGNYYLSFTNILLIAIVLIMITKLK